MLQSNHDTFENPGIINFGSYKMLEITGTVVEWIERLQLKR